MEAFDKCAGLGERETPTSMAATMMLSALLSWSRAMVIRRAIVLADGTFCRF
jgi:hypothetical protein